MINHLQKDKYFLTRISFRISVTKKSEKLWNCKCPVNGCDDNNRKKRFFFIDKGTHILAYCHDCGYSSSLGKFIKDKFPEFVEDYAIWGFAKKDKSLAEKATMALEAVEEKEIPTYVTVEKFNQLTTDPNDLADDHAAKKYIKMRRIPFHLVRYCENFYELTRTLYQEDTFEKYPKSCMLIPFHRANERIEIFQARFFDPKIRPKYITVKFNPEARKIYNGDFVDEEKRIHILEGPVDAMFCPNSVALGGSDGIVSYKDQVWVFDNEPDNFQINKKILAKIQQKEKVIIWKPSDVYKDINEGIVKGMIKKEDVPRILRARTFSGLKARLEFAKFKK